MMNTRILVVDDQKDNLETIVNFIEEDNQPYELLQALNAGVALKIARAEIPDLIITDWEMPGKDGIEFIKELKNSPKLADIPVIMCTGVMLTSSDLKTALEAGAVDYIRKPIDKVELLARINSVLRLAKSHEKIKELNEAKDRIFSVIAHDLSTPVGNIKQFVGWIIEQPDSFSKEELLRNLKGIKEQSSSVYQTLETLLNWAMCQTKSKIFAPGEHDFVKIVYEAEDLFQYAIFEKELEIVKKLPDKLFAYFDREMVATVVRNLLSNAIKFSHNGGKIKIAASISDGALVFSIKDYGVGIAKKYIELIFTGSNYYSTYGTNNEKGSGLGLKICKEFVEMHQGKIIFQSKINQGTKFSVTIPSK